MRYFRNSTESAENTVSKLVALLPMKFINTMINKACTKYNKKDTGYIYEVCNSNRKFKPLKAEMYTSLCELPFREKTFMAVANYDEFLKSRFGENYMAEMPSEDKRGRSHIQEVYIDNEIINKR